MMNYWSCHTSCASRLWWILLSENCDSATWLKESGYELHEVTQR
ncbi:unnamed protein product [Tenebrio molitor]|nr:unnamed protein product [Tenebrio molitor]